MTVRREHLYSVSSMTGRLPGRFALIALTAFASLLSAGACALHAGGLNFAQLPGEAAGVEGPFGSGWSLRPRTQAEAILGTVRAMLRMDDADHDGDSLPDAADADSDGNGTTDPDRIDRDCDGIDDHADATFCPHLRDTDRDGLVDRYDLDDDNDRIPDCLDRDLDGDGLLNEIEQDAEAVDPCSGQAGGGRMGSCGSTSDIGASWHRDLPDTEQPTGRLVRREMEPCSDGVIAAPFVPPRAG